MDKAYAAMDALEKGAIANPDENRMVGHYWLRAPELAPDPAIAAEIRATVAAAKAFAADVHSGGSSPSGPAGSRGCSRSASAARRWGRSSWPMRSGHPGTDKLEPHFVDNTDPEGIARELARLDGRARRDPGRGHEQERDHAGDAQRDAGRRRGLPRRRASTSPGMPWPSPARARSSTSRPRRGMAGAGSRCGTGSAAGPARCRPWVWSPASSRASTWTACSPAPRRWTWPRASTTPRRTPPRSWP